MENNMPFTNLLRRLCFEYVDHNHWRCITIPGYILHVSVFDGSDDGVPAEYYVGFRRLIGGGSTVTHSYEGFFYTSPGAVSWLADQLIGAGVR